MIYCDGKANNYYEVVNVAINELFTKMNLDIKADLVADANTIRKTYYSDLYDKSLQVIAPELCEDWDYEKNGDLIPSMFKPQSNVKMWWKCHKCGYEWESGISSRYKHRGCPACTNQVVWIGHNDLLSRYPDVAKEWNYEKNQDLLPENVTAKSGKRVWWKCSKGHEWQAIIYQRTQIKTGCPYCSGKRIITGVSDLLTVRPDLAKEWDYEKNINESIVSVGIGSHKKVWWKCDKGHEWQARIYDRTRGNGCPYCAGRKRAIKCIETGKIYPDAKSIGFENGVSTTVVYNVLSGKKDNLKGKHYQYSSLLDVKDEN